MWRKDAEASELNIILTKFGAYINDVMQILTIFNHPTPLCHTLIPRPYALRHEMPYPPPPLCKTSFMNDPLIKPEHDLSFLIKCKVVLNKTFLLQKLADFSRTIKSKVYFHLDI